MCPHKLTYITPRKDEGILPLSLTVSLFLSLSLSRLLLSAWTQQQNPKKNSLTNN